MFKFRDIRFISKKKSYFELNIYLNRSKINDATVHSNYLNALSLVRYDKPMNRNEFESILLNYQNFTCTKCKQAINTERDHLEIDHKPSVYILSKIALTDILNIISIKLYNKKFKHIDSVICFESFTKELQNFDIKNYFKNNIFNKIKYSLAHKNCN